MKSIKPIYYVASVIIIVLITATRARNSKMLSSSVTNGGIVSLWFIGLIWLNIIVNHERLDDKLVVEDKLLSYPRHKLALAGCGIIISMIYISDPFGKLTWSFAAASIFLWRDHRWSAFLALDTLIITIVMLLLQEQSLADAAAIYLYYFLVIATLTMLTNKQPEEKPESEEITLQD